MQFLFFASDRARILGGWAATVWVWDVQPKNPFEPIVFPAVEADRTLETRLETFSDAESASPFRRQVLSSLWCGYGRRYRINGDQ
jgi:hypothetical protein